MRHRLQGDLEGLNYRFTPDEQQDFHASEAHLRQLLALAEA
jgi:hypothetical protein